MSEGKRNFLYPSKSNSAPSEQPFLSEGKYNKNDGNDSAIFCGMSKIRPYTRRNKSRSKGVSIRPHATDCAPMGDGNKSLTLPSCKNSRITNDLCKPNNPKGHSVSSLHTSESTCLDGNVETLDSDNQFNKKLVAVKAHGTTGGLRKVVPDCKFSTGSEKYELKYEPATAEEKNLCIFQCSGFKPTEKKNQSVPINTNVLQLESYFIECNHQLHGNIAKDQSPFSRKVNSNVNTKDQTLALGGNPKLNVHISKENSNKDVSDAVRNECSTCPNLSEKGSSVKGNLNNQSGNVSNFKIPGSSSQSRSPRIVDSSSCELTSNTLSEGDSTISPVTQSCLNDNLKLVNQAHEDSILKEAKAIEERYKSIAELSLCSFFLETRERSHWDYLLEEMAWLANDFMQERLWKIAAAAQVCHSVASAVRYKFDDKISDLGNVEIPHEVKFLEESLFYTVSTGAWGRYRNLVESDWLESKSSKLWGMHVLEMKEKMSPYNVPGAFRGCKSLRSSLKGQKGLPKSCTAGSYEVRGGIPYEHHSENKLGSHSSIIMEKRSLNILQIGSIPTKRARTVSRKRVQCPSIGEASEVVQVGKITDLSSGDTNSFQDQQNIVHEDLHISKYLNVECVRGFQKNLPTDCTEIPATLENAEARHVDSAYECGWQRDTIGPKEQRDHSEQRSEYHQHESNGYSGPLGQHVVKKPSILEKLSDTFTQGIIARTGCPLASETSNASNLNKSMKKVSCRHRRKKTKSLQMPTGQSESRSGNSWSPSQDQALFVFVHDLGPNWELVSDAINSTLLFKDNGRNVCPRVVDSTEFDILKSRFQKIILIGKQGHTLKSQNNTLDQKQKMPVHSSQVLSISQANSNGGPLTPLDLCDSTTSGPDVFSHGYQRSHPSGLMTLNTVSLVPVVPVDTTSSMPQGSADMIKDNSLSTPSTTCTPSTRYGNEFGLARGPSLLISEQQKVRQLSRVLSIPRTQYSSSSVPGVLPASDHSVQIPHGESGTEMMHGMNRSLATPHPGLQRIGSHAATNMSLSGSLLSSNRIRTPSSISMRVAAASCEGNSRTPNPGDQKRETMKELEVQVRRGSSQDTLSVNGLSTGFFDHVGSSSVQKDPSQRQQHQKPQQSHPFSNPDHSHLQGSNSASIQQKQIDIPPLAKEKQLKQRLVNRNHPQQQQKQKKQQKQNQHHAVLNSSMPNGQSYSQPSVLSFPETSSLGRQQVSLQSESPRAVQNSHILLR
ncbi:hypothetical protein IFM89_005028 [Coptis chinensis]|uniref:HSA domain-containing protein n=1 Tax=Coptis chinensis TaxID=261450 RepID=A0A835LQW4_9MAGN|nr:hypothetical protein IFM89_005028 [Coptis chinensis]